MTEEDFPELVELKAMQQRRHRQVIAGLIAGGIVAIAAGLSIFAFSEGGRPAGGIGAVAIVLIGAGAITMVRGVISAVTDYDLKPRGDLDPLIPYDDEDDEDDAGDEGEVVRYARTESTDTDEDA